MTQFNLDDYIKTRPWINVTDTGAPALDVDAVIRRADPPVISESACGSGSTPVWVYAVLISVPFAVAIFLLMYWLSGQ